jgi:hypothetical protein
VAAEDQGEVLELKMEQIKEGREDGLIVAEFVITRPVTLSDDDIERMKRHDEFDIVMLAKRGIELVRKPKSETF